eukprot:gene7848-16060_t
MKLINRRKRYPPTPIFSKRNRIKIRSMKTAKSVTVKSIEISTDVSSKEDQDVRHTILTRSRTVRCSETEIEKRKIESLEHVFGEGTDVFNNAIYWTRQNWTADMPPIISITPNPGLKYNCPCMLKFLEGIKKHNVNIKSSSSYFFSWHGTQLKSNIQNILDMGFNPELRKTQTFGPGEYFGFTPAISRAYCGSSNFIIVAIIVTGSWLSNHQNFCWIVENPSDFNCTYVLPLLLVNFGVSDTLQLKVYE